MHKKDIIKLWDNGQNNPSRLGHFFTIFTFCLLIKSYVVFEVNSLLRYIQNSSTTVIFKTLVLEISLTLTQTLPSAGRKGRSPQTRMTAGGDEW